MCGIVGYIGRQNAVPILLNGLRHLEYRGYDSAGVAIITDGELRVEKRVGKVAELEQAVAGALLSGTVGIGHTRWATHGEPNNVNAHPHCDCSGTIALVHNGIVENHAAIRTKLERDGHRFRSDTDTESLAHLVEAMYSQVQNLAAAVRLALSEVDGAYGIAVVSSREPDKIIVARKGSPLVVGVGNGEYFVASDAAAIISHTRHVIYLEDGEMAILERDNYQTKTITDIDVQKQVQEITLDIEQIEKGGFPHFMLKEIHEQPETIRNAMRGRILLDDGTAKLGGLSDVINKMRYARRFIITACGTSWHAGLVGEYMLEQYAQVPTETEYASEFRYRCPIIRDDDVIFLISQSGETADTLAALREAKRKGAAVLGICNVVGSTIARETDGGVYIHAGPEIGVASTKAFTSQLVVLALVTLMLGRMKSLSVGDGQRICSELLALPQKVKEILNDSLQVERIADEFKHCRNFLYLGRGYNFPVALEGALKLKEISYIHAEGYPAAEMKHGPIALIDKDMPVVVIAPHDDTYEKIVSNIQEVRARNGRVIAITNEEDERLERLAEHVIRIPKTLPFLTPIVAIIPLQLLAYHIAVRRGCNVDQPRNLAKSVTVE